LPGILVFGPGAPRGCHEAPRGRDLGAPLNQLQWLTYPSGKHTKNYGKSPFLMGKSGKSTISMAMFNSYVKLPEGIFPNIWKKLEK